MIFFKYKDLELLLLALDLLVVDLSEAAESDKNVKAKLPGAIEQIDSIKKTIKFSLERNHQFLVRD